MLLQEKSGCCYFPRRVRLLLLAALALHLSSLFREVSYFSLSPPLVFCFRQFMLFYITVGSFNYFAIYSNSRKLVGWRYYFDRGKLNEGEEICYFLWLIPRYSIASFGDLL